MLGATERRLDYASFELDDDITNLISASASERKMHRNDRGSWLLHAFCFKPSNEKNCFLSAYWIRKTGTSELNIQIILTVIIITYVGIPIYPAYQSKAEKFNHVPTGEKAYQLTKYFLPASFMLCLTSIQRKCHLFQIVSDSG